MGFLFGKRSDGGVTIEKYVVAEHEGGLTWRQLSIDGTTQLQQKAAEYEKQGLIMVGWVHSHHTEFAPCPSIVDINAHKSMQPHGEVMVILGRERGAGSEAHVVAWKFRPEYAKGFGKVDNPLHAVELMTLEFGHHAFEVAKVGETIWKGQ